jgi:type I restriction enzyme S subunit
MELLDRHFDTAFDAPDGIKKLRELILTLAMQGKLLPQDPNDPPASELLKKIEAEKKKLVNQGKIKEPKPLAPIAADEVPYALPHGWEWVRLGTIADYNGRDNADPKDIDKDCWVLDLEDIEKTTSRLLYRAKYSERESKSTKSQFKAGDVLYGKLRPYLDKVIVANSDGVCTTELVPIVPSKAMVAHFLRWMLKSPSFLRYVNGLMYGVKMPRLGTDDAINSIHPLPPLNEQLRIVAKIDELMARCDALEKLRAARDAKRLAVHSAAVRQLLNVADTHGHTQARDFLGQHFGELYTVKENVTELRKVILQLAVTGKLVPQDPNDPPARELLKQIETEKKRLVKEGKIKETKPLHPLNSEVGPYSLPEGWEWVRLGQIALIERGGSPRPINAFLTDAPNGLNWIKIGDTQKGGKFITSTSERIRPEGLSKTRKVYPGDFLLTNSMSFGRPYITQIEGCIHDGWLRISPPKSVNKDYLYNLLSSSFIRTLFETAASGAVVQNLNADKVRELPIPLPPVNEQSRIVTKIDQLMGLCDVLEQQIDAGREMQSALLNAMMAQYGGQRCA